MRNHDSCKVFITPPFAGRLRPLFLALAMATMIVGQAGAETSAPGDRWPTCTGTATMQRLSFVHVSDIHARYNPEPNGETPVGRIRGYYEAVKRDNPHTVFTNGGHGHNVLEKAIRVKGTRIVHAGANADHIGRLDLDYDLAARRIAASDYRLVRNRSGLIPTDPGIDRTVAGILHRYRNEMDEIVATVTKDQGRLEIAGIAALAAASLPGVDAAFVNPASVWQDRWRGTLTRQNLFDTFKVEREPAGTPGTSSLYLLRVKGGDLLRARRALRDFTYAGPKEAIAADASYTIAVHKAQATRQEHYFGRPISIIPPQPATELWQTVAAFAGERGRLGLTLDGEAETRSPGDSQRLLAGVELRRVPGKAP